MAHWIVFAGLGPLLGFAIVLLGYVLSGTALPLSPVFFVLLGVPLAYLFGWIPSILTAFAIRQLQVRQVSHEGLWASVVGLGIGAAFPFILAVLGVADFRSLTIEGVVGSAIFCLALTLICWFLSKRLAKTLDAPDL